MNISTPCLEKCSPVVRIGETQFGGGSFSWIAGPCAVESREQMVNCAETLRKCGIRVMRGGLFKPRTSPYSFQGLRENGLALLEEIRSEFGMAFVCEAVDAESLEFLQKTADAIQIGARNCLNYALLEAAGRCGKPIILKRGFAVTVAEWLNAAEYLALNGAREILLCERGIRTVTEVTRFTLDFGGALWLKAHYSMPVIADPSHAAGDATLVPALTMAAAAAGLDGVMLECSPAPECTHCDSRQQLTPNTAAELKKQTDQLRASIRSGYLSPGH